MTNAQRVALWDAIHDVVTASGGNAACTSVARQKAVVDVENVVKSIAAPLTEPVRDDVRDLLLRVEHYIEAVNGWWRAQHPEEAAELLGRELSPEEADEDAALEALGELGSALRGAAFRVQRRLDRGQL